MEHLSQSTGIATRCVRAGQGSRPGEPLVVPIVQSTTFCQAPGATPDHAYSRVSNPTVAALEEAIGALEDAPPAVCFGSGLAAEAAVFLTLLTAGDHVVCSRAVYGGTTRLLDQVLGPLGVTVSFVDTTDVEAVRTAIGPATRILFIETPANPTLDVSDIRTLTQIAHDRGVQVVVDNTFLTPVLQQPLELGADITVASTTKYIDGHSVALGGAVVSRDEAVLDRLRFIRKCTGAIQAPFDAWLTLQGLKTLPVRIRRQSETAARIAAWLSSQPEIVEVFYPRGTVAERQHCGGHGAVVSCRVAGGIPAISALVGHLRLCRFVEHVGSVETLITHPASMTHADVTPERRARDGVRDDLIRISVGLEDADDIIADLDQALRRIGTEQEIGGVACRRSA